MSRVLVIAAHPDDELLGPGATLARHAMRGDEVHGLILSDGATSRYPDEMVAALADAARRAAKTLGFTSTEVCSLPDQRLDTIPLLDVTRIIERVVDQVGPDVVYTHFPGDVNSDHGVVARAAWVACRPYVVPRLQRFAVYETPSSTEWAWPLDGGVFAPTLFVDVSATLAVKLEAMQCYASELRDYPHPRSLAALTERAAYWGGRVGRTAAEAFQVLREVS